MGKCELVPELVDNTCRGCVYRSAPGTHGGECTRSECEESCMEGVNRIYIKATPEARREYINTRVALRLGLISVEGGFNE